MCVTDRHDMTLKLAVKVVLNPNTTNQLNSKVIQVLIQALILST